MSKASPVSPLDGAAVLYTQRGDPARLPLRNSGTAFLQRG